MEVVSCEHISFQKPYLDCVCLRVALLSAHWFFSWISRSLAWNRHQYGTWHIMGSIWVSSKHMLKCSATRSRYAHFIRYTISQPLDLEVGEVEPHRWCVASHKDALTPNTIIQLHFKSLYLESQVCDLMLPLLLTARHVLVFLLTVWHHGLRLLCQHLGYVNVCNLVVGMHINNVDLLSISTSLALQPQQLQIQMWTSESNTAQRGRWNNQVLFPSSETLLDCSVQVCFRHLVVQMNRHGDISTALVINDKDCVDSTKNQRSEVNHSVVRTCRVILWGQPFNFDGSTGFFLKINFPPLISNEKYNLTV